MSDPSSLTDALDAARDAFRHAHGAPTFEPTINANTDAKDGEVQIQKACRLIKAATVLQQSGEYYGSVLEHAFASIERTLEGYLIAFADYDVTDFHYHTTVYRRGKQQVPLTPETLETLEALYDDRRTEHYYGTTVTTKRQAETMLEVANALHEHIVQFGPKLTGYCNCGG